MSWKDLAQQAAEAIGVDPRIVLATVEAETGGRNILGDDGYAMGYGQVWAQKWHYQKLLNVADMLGYDDVPSRDDLEGLQQYITENDELSMYLAANTIKSFWDSSGGDWERFTKSYVGSGIPSHDLERRRNIWKKYENMDIGGVDFNIPFPGPKATKEEREGWWYAFGEYWKNIISGNKDKAQKVIEHYEKGIGLPSKEEKREKVKESYRDLREKVFPWESVQEFLKQSGIVIIGTLVVIVAFILLFYGNFVQRRESS